MGGEQLADRSGAPRVLGPVVAGGPLGSLSKSRPPAWGRSARPTLEATVENFSAVSRGIRVREKQMTA